MVNFDLRANTKRKAITSKFINLNISILKNLV